MLSSLSGRLVRHKAGIAALPLTESVILIESKPNLRNAMFVAFGFSAVQMSVDVQEDNAYAQRLGSEYAVLSRLETGIGYSRWIHPKWQIHVGLRYNQFRLVFRGETVKQSTTQVESDTATVYTNSLGGDIYQAGTISRTTTISSDIQQ